MSQTKVELGLDVKELSTITTADNTATLTLKSTDADASVGPILSLVRDSGSPADADFIGAVRFFADNDAGESIQFAEIDVQIDDASDGTEDGQVFVRSMSGGSTRDRIGIYGNNTVFNDGGLDIDFRIESENNANMFKIDAADDTLLIGGTGVNPATTTSENHTAFANNGSMSISKNSTCITTNRTGTEGTTVEFRQAGGVRGSISVGGSTTAFNTSSDYRLKENVDYTWDGTAILKQLKPAKFNWIVDPDTTVHGFIAHEAKTVVPDSVIGEKAV